jgi:tRNA(Arg) A34 adenosine deaminase TadA
MQQISMLVFRPIVLAQAHLAAFFQAVSASGRVLRSDMARPKTSPSKTISSDERCMRDLVGFTARTFETGFPSPFGALIVETHSGKELIRSTNAVMRENDPSAHAETRTVRLACQSLKRASLAGYTMYSTCEPCPMCMSNALWAHLDRVVYGATIEDANRHTLQIHIPAKEVVRRSDMSCVVDGPVQRRLCNTLFEDPRMQKAFKSWSSSKFLATKNGKKS